MAAPQGLAVGCGNMVCKSKKSLYGLKQASRQWYDKMAHSLCSKGYHHSTSDYSLFYKRKGCSLVFVSIYVDNIIMTGTDIDDINSLKAFLNDQFKINDLGKLHYFLGLENLYRHDGVLISQRKFTLDLLKDFDVLNYKATTSPLYFTEKLKATDGKLLYNPTHYRQLVGKLNFLTYTRMDIAFIVQHLSQFMQTPRDPHLKAAYHVLRYLKQDPTMRIFISNKHDLTISAFCDTNWVACPDSRKFVSCYLVIMGDSCINWKCKKQAPISFSSTNVEYRVVRQVVGELVWLERLLHELTVKCSLTIHVHCDSQPAVHIAKNQVFHGRTKHIEIDFHFVRTKNPARLITLHHKPTDSQLVDIFTKALTGVKHATLRCKFFVITSPPTK